MSRTRSWQPRRIRATQCSTGGSARPVVAQIATDAETERDPSKSAGLYRKLDERIAQVGPYAPLFQPAVPYAFRANVQGVTSSSVWGVDFWTVSK